jgi:hypothetical protein
MFKNQNKKYIGNLFKNASFLKLTIFFIVPFIISYFSLCIYSEKNNQHLILFEVVLPSQKYNFISEMDLLKALTSEPFRSYFKNELHKDSNITSDVEIEYTLRKDKFILGLKFSKEINPNYIGPILEKTLNLYYANNITLRSDIYVNKAKSNVNKILELKKENSFLYQKMVSANNFYSEDFLSRYIINIFEIQRILKLNDDYLSDVGKGFAIRIIESRPFHYNLYLIFIQTYISSFLFFFFLNFILKYRKKNEY